MPGEKIYYWLLILLLITFTAFTIPTLSMPLYGDEASVGVSAFGFNTLSLIQQQPYVGHPPLIFLFSKVLSLFLELSPVILHLIPLFFALMALVFIYKIGETIDSKLTGILAAILTAVFPLFVVQSRLFLLDMPWVAFALAGFYFYLKKRYSFMVYFGILAALMKETSLIFFTVLVLYDFLTHIQNPIKYGLKRWYFALPYLGLIGWWIFSKVAYGYFISPLHGAFWSWNLYKTLIIPEAFRGMIWWQFRNYLWIPALLSLRIKRARFLFAVIFSYTLFHSFLYSNRYMLITVPCLILMAILGISNRPLKIGFSCIMVIFLVTTFYPGFFVNYDETSLNYQGDIESHQRAIGYIVENYPNETIMAIWPNELYLRYPIAGYVKEGLNVVGFPKEADIAMVTSDPEIFRGEEYNSLINLEYESVFETKFMQSWARVYVRGKTNRLVID